MKKLVLCGVLSIGLGLLGTGNSVEASRARNLVMGTGDFGYFLNGGSLYTEDLYNVFYNPSYATDFKDWVIIEKSNSTNLNGAATGGRAQGGFFSSFLNFNFGFFFNRVQAIQGVYTAPANFRPVEIFIAGETGLKWGLTVSHGGARSGGTTTGSETNVGIGFQVASFAPFASVGFGNNSTGGVETSNSNFRVGTTYDWGEWKPYVGYRNVKAAPNGGTELNTTTIGGGIGRNTKAGEGVYVNYGISFWKIDRKDRWRISTIPLYVSVEGSPASFVTLRAGLAFPMMNQLAGDPGAITTDLGAGVLAGSIADSTSGRLGATFHVGAVDFDWAVGNNGALGTGEALTTADAQVFDLTSGFFAAASLTYRW